MKKLSRYLLLAAAVMFMYSCETQEPDDLGKEDNKEEIKDDNKDDNKEDNKEDEKEDEKPVPPEPVDPYDYLKDYDVLKSYVNTPAPDFKLGLATSAYDYAKKGDLYNLVNANFHEITAGNAMKYASVVGADGSMNFSTVKSFIEAAKSAGTTIYGHTLAWHSQQNVRYLNSLLKPKRVEDDSNDAVNYYIFYDCGEAGANIWDKQATYPLSQSLETGSNYTLTVDIKASSGCTCALWPIWDESPNKNQWGGSDDVIYLAEERVGTEWATCTWTFNAIYPVDKLQFVFGKHGGLISFDNFVLKKNGTNVNLIENGDFAEKTTGDWGANYGGPTFSIEEEQASKFVELTPEEKKEVLTGAMDNWIKGMMEATAGYVTAWDAVNEAISGHDGNGDGIYDLQTANANSGNDFFWQDYLGSEDYVRIVVEKARKYYAEFGGTAPLRLFINDYNLESDWDDNKKLKSLIEWIKIWESDGKTKIDGIGTQMHVSYYADPNTQASKERHYVKMLQLMAATGKLVKITELDMGYVGRDGKSVTVSQMTEEQHKQMAEYYKFIVKKYFEIVPYAQQYGITQWCMTDAVPNSGWRADEPVGLWDLNYNRKHTYAGFADGLKGDTWE